MKKIILFSLGILLCANLMAQNVQETTVQYGDFTVPAFTVTLTQDEEVVLAAINQRLKESQVKTTKTGGYTAALNQTFDVIYSQPVDFYAKVESQGKKKDRVTVVTFFAKSPNLTISQNELNVNVRTFTENFSSYVSKFEAQQMMGASAKNLEKAQKEQKKAQDAVASIDKSIASDRDKIAKKEKDIEKLQAKIEDVRKDIEKLNANIEKNNKKKAEAEEKLNSANSKVNSSESEVERYRQQAQ